MAHPLPIVSPYGYGENMRAVDVARSVENKKKYVAIYDAWDDESPAAVNQQFSAELRERLRGGTIEN